MDTLKNRYQVQQQLGKKAGRRTFLAQDLQTQQPVVVKVLTFGDGFDWDDLKLFEREAGTLQDLNHPAIPSYLDSFDLEPNGFAIVQSYIEARSLEQHLKAGRNFSEAEVKQIARDLLKILAYLHERQPPVIHRDLKPSNILLSDRTGNNAGQVYLVDFGSVQTLAAKEGGTITVVGTYGYMPPEQFGGRATPASDLYSLGATLIYLATGKHPADLPQDDLRIDFEPITPNLSQSFKQWLRQLIEPSLKRRFASVDQALHALNHQGNIRQNAWATLTPTGTKIKIKETDDTLDILLPPIGSRALFSMVGLRGLASSGFFLLILAGSLPVGIALLIIAIFFWHRTGNPIVKLLRQLFRHRRIRINSTHLSMNSETLGLKRWHYPAYQVDVRHLNHFNHTWVPFPERAMPRNAITRIVYIPGHWARDNRGNRVNIPPQICIWADRWAYEITPLDLGIRRNEEMEWLAYEISRWLGLPLDRT